MGAPSNRIVVTVDGLAGSGKTTLARMLAERAGFAHLNSGLLYRAVALITLREKLNPEDPAALGAAIDRHSVELKPGNVPHKSKLYIDGIDVTANVSSPEVSEATSLTARHAAVRDRLVRAQREAFAGLPIVAEGRDMGTVIFPDAPLKFFVVADESVRVARRLEQLYGDPKKLSSDERKSLNQKIQIEIVERDKRDQTRALAPTVPAADSITIDNSREALTVVLARMYDALSVRGLLSK